MQRALVTGGSGFIGSHLVEHLSTRGFEVHVTTRHNATNGRNLHPVDVTDSAAVLSAVRTIQPRHIFHLAASNVMSGRISSAQDVVNVNVLGAFNLLEAAKEIPLASFVMAGSFLEYGVKGRPLREVDQCEPAEIYAISKLSATLLGQSLARTSDLPVVTFRIFTPYGPRVQKGRLIHEVIKKALADEPIPLTQMNTTRDFIYVDDVCELLIEGAAKAKRHAGQTFNLGSGQKTRLQDLVALIIENTNSKSVAHWDAFPRLAYDADSWQADMAKTFAAFSWRPKTSIVDGMAKTIAWFSSNM